MGALQSSRIKSAVLLAVLLVTGCAHKSLEYEPPTSERYVTDAFSENAFEGAKAFPGYGWWKDFQNPALDELINTALEKNATLEAATVSLLEAHKSHELVLQNRSPLGGLRANAGSSFASSSAQEGQNDAFAATSDFSLSSFFSWEIDIYGRIRSQTEISKAEINIAEATLAQVQQAIVAEVVTAYIQNRGAEARIEAAQKNISLQKDTLQSVTKLFKFRALTRLDLERAKANYERLKSDLSPLKLDLQLTRNRLAVLTGEPPALFDLNSIAGLEQLNFPENLLLSDPAHLIKQRPDIQIAERRVKIATEQVNVDTSDLYPRFSLSSDLSLANQSISALLREGSFQYSFGPNMEWALFEFPRTKLRIERQELRVQEAIANFDQTILSALEETENALSAYAAETKRLESLKLATLASRNVRSMSQNRFNAGVGSLFELLDAEQEVSDFEDALIQSETLALVRLVQVYRSFGGEISQ